jgi:hypothetical protein
LLIRAINYLDNGNRDGEHVNNNNKYWLKWLLQEQLCHKQLKQRL